jgi:hypothetical protein
LFVLADHIDVPARGKAKCGPPICEKPEPAELAVPSKLCRLVSRGGHAATSADRVIIDAQYERTQGTQQYGVTIRSNGFTTPRNTKQGELSDVERN